MGGAGRTRAAATERGAQRAQAQPPAPAGCQRDRMEKPAAAWARAPLFRAHDLEAHSSGRALLGGARSSTARLGKCGTQQ